MKVKLIYLALLLIGLSACGDNAYLSDVYVKPVAKFEVPKEKYNVFESVVFTNKGQGQRYVVFTGDQGHKYDESAGTGFSTSSNGLFSYSYQEPGRYKAVWIASSVNADGVIEQAVDSTWINVVSDDGGLEKLTIMNIYKLNEYGGVLYCSAGEFVGERALLCPVLFASWRDATVNTIKTKLLVNFELSSTYSRMFWYNPKTGADQEIISGNSSSRIVEFVQDGRLAVQRFIVKSDAGTETSYEVAPVMIPEITKFTLNGVNGTITRDIAYYDRFNIEIKLPVGTDLSSLVPDFEIMKNDPNLTDGTNVTATIGKEVQVSGTTPVDFSRGAVTYTLMSRLLGSDNPKYTLEAQVKVNVTLQ